MNKNIILMGLLLGAQSINASWWGCCGDASVAVRPSHTPNLGQNPLAGATGAADVITSENNNVPGRDEQKDKRVVVGNNRFVDSLASSLISLDHSVISDLLSPIESQWKLELAEKEFERLALQVGEKHRQNLKFQKQITELQKTKKTKLQQKT